MVIELYKTNSDNNVVHKKLTNKATYNNVELVRYDKNRDTMTINIIDTINVDINYSKINNKYYYCKPIINEYDFTTLELVIDPLMTYADDIGECLAEINRANNNPNYYINDGFFKTDSKSKVEYIQGWSNIGTPSAYIVTTGA